MVVDRSQPRCWVPALPFSFFLFLRSGGGGGGGGKQQPMLGTCVFFFSLFFVWTQVGSGGGGGEQTARVLGTCLSSFCFFFFSFVSSLFFLFWVVVDKPNSIAPNFLFLFFTFSKWVVVVVNKLSSLGARYLPFLLLVMFFVTPKAGVCVGVHCSGGHAPKCLQNSQCLK